MKEKHARTWNTEKENQISSQSFTTPAMFIVSADVLPISMKTAQFNAKAQSAFKRSRMGLKETFPSISSGITLPASTWVTISKHVS